MSEYIWTYEELGDGKVPVWRSTGEQVVRCKDCTFYTDELGLSEVKPEREYCERYSHYDGEWDVDVYHYTEPDDFCSFGKRKEVE